MLYENSEWLDEDEISLYEKKLQKTLGKLTPAEESAKSELDVFINLEDEEKTYK
jgi:hypothetical protein